MPRSNLEIYVNILEVLAAHNSLNLTSIMYEANLNNKTAKGYIDFLVTNELVNVTSLNKKRSSYMLTPKGNLLLKMFRKLKNTFKLEDNPLLF
jgi:predicted transcriptional regulator